MKKNIILILSLCTLLAGCSNLISENKKTNQNFTAETGTVNFNLKKCENENLNQRTISPDGSDSFMEATWKLTFTSEAHSEIKEDVVFESNGYTITLPVGTYSISAEGSLENGLIWTGTVTDVEIKTGIVNPVTIFVSLEKEGTGNLTYTAKLNSSIQINDISSQPVTATLENIKSGNKYTISTAEPNDNGSIEYADNSLVINFTSIPSAFYKLSIKYRHSGGDDYYLMVPDFMVEISDNRTTSATVDVSSSLISFTYYATNNDSTYNGLSNDYPVNFETLLNSLANSDNWYDATIYCNEEPDMSVLTETLLSKIENEIKVYFNNAKLFSIIDNKIVYYDLVFGIEKVEDGGTIYVSNNAKINSSIVINKNITISGQSESKLHVTAINQDLSSIFNITGGDYESDAITVNISNLVIDGNDICQGIKSSGYGTFNFNNIEIINCNTEELGGGASFSDNGNYTISNSTIKNNTSTYSDGDGGGGFRFNKVNVTLENCTIEENTTYRSGGGIYAGRGGNIILTNCQITSNSTAGDNAEFGGGIYIDGITKLILTDCTISSNTAYGNGGGIFNYSVPIELINTEITGNTASNGGAIKTEGLLTITDSYIHENTTTDTSSADIDYSDNNLHVGGNTRIVDDTITSKIVIDSLITTEEISYQFEGKSIGDVVLIKGDDLSEEDFMTSTKKFTLDSTTLYIDNTGTVISDLISAYALDTPPVLSTLKYQIKTKEDLFKLTNWVAQGTYFKDYTFEIMNDIDLECTADSPWTPIGKGYNSTYAFMGNINGNNHTISGIYINADTTVTTCPSFIGCYGNGTIKDLTLSGESLYAGFVGILLTGGVIENCINKISITNANSGAYAGGFAGRGDGGTVLKCTNEANITGVKNTGGIMGMVNVGSTKIIGCINKGNITGSKCYIGGIVGSNFGIVRNCLNMGEVSGEVSSDAYSIGGIAGTSQCISSMSETISNCYNTGSVSGSYNVGGILGNSNTNSDLSYNSYVRNCYNTGTVTATTTGATHGCIVGVKTTGGSGVQGIENNYYLASTGSYGIGIKTGTPEENVLSQTASFTTAGGQSTLSEAITIGDNSSTDLVQLLNYWISAQTTPSNYYSWTYDTDTTSATYGLPVFVE